MSKFTIKLEKLIHDVTFGDLLLTVQYDATGPKIISIEGEKITPDLSSSMTLMLYLVNLCLTKGIAVKEISDHLPVKANNKLLTLVLSSLKDLPARIQEIQATDVIEIKSSMLKELM